MEDLNDKVTLGNLAAAEWNQVPSEIQNVIVDTGQTLSAGDLNQLGKGIANYVGNSNFYTDNNVADVYALTATAPTQSITAYTDGLAVEFIPSQSNTGPSQVSVGALSLVDIRDSNDVALVGGEIVAGRRLLLKHDISSGRFFIDSGTIPNNIIQTTKTEVGGDATGTLTFPIDDSIPQIDEGTEFMSRMITPTSAGSLLEVSVDWNGTANDSLGVIIALFRDANVDALATVYSDSADIFTQRSISLKHTVLAGSTALTTFKLRAGTGSNFSTIPDVFFNGRALSEITDVASITESGDVATLTTTSDHKLGDQEVVFISGATITGYNVGDVSITVTSPDTFTYAVSGPLANETGPGNVIVTTPIRRFGGTMASSITIREVAPSNYALSQST